MIFIECKYSMVQWKCIGILGYTLINLCSTNETKIINIDYYLKKKCRLNKNYVRYKATKNVSVNLLNIITR